MPLKKIGSLVRRLSLWEVVESFYNFLLRNSSIFLYVTLNVAVFSLLSFYKKTLRFVSCLKCEEFLKILPICAVFLRG